MPRDKFTHHTFLPREDVLSFEEITRLTRILLPLGVQKIRLSGGEPLLRKDLPELVALLAALKNKEDKAPEIAITTNAALLKNNIAALKKAGLTRLTISLDALEEDVFQQITDSSVSVATVLEAIHEAKTQGFTSIKVNAVIQKGVNDAQILPLVAHFKNSGIILRFIEFMDVGNVNAWQLNSVFSAAEIEQLINEKYPLTPISPNYQGEVAKRFLLNDKSAEIGIIASVTQPFCGDCSRLRLSTNGKLYTCLFAQNGLDVRTLLRNGASDERIQNAIAHFWQQRTDRYSEQRLLLPAGTKKIEMSYIGG